MKAPVSALLLLALASPATAKTFTPPQGCEVFMTVQARQCRVSNHYRCTQDAEGDQWRADFDQDGLFFMSRINGEAEWVESYDMGNPVVRQTLGPNPQDRASFSELVSSGADSFAFGLSDDTGAQSSVTGYDRLTGRTIVIDGISLRETEFEFTETDPSGTVLRQSRGNEYIHPDWRLFFAGPSEWNGGDGNFLPLDGSPVEFVFPGESGFATTEPLFDCDAVMSSLSPEGSRG